MVILFYLLAGLPIIPQDYKLQIGDEVTVYVSGSINFNYTETISPQGTIFIYSQEIIYTDNVARRLVLSEIKIVSLTLDSAKQTLQEEFNKYFKNITLSLVITQFRDVVYVSGAVAMPGAYPFFPGQTAMYYIGKAGGLNERANLQNMYVLKANRTKLSLNKTKEIDRYDTIIVEYLPLNLWSQYIGIVSTFVTIIATWIALTR